MIDNVNFIVKIYMPMDENVDSGTIDIVQLLLTINEIN